MPNLAQVAKALADPRRAELTLTLIDGRAWTPTELATHHSERQMPFEFRDESRPCGGSFPY